MKKQRELIIKPLPEIHQGYWDAAYDFRKNIIYLGRMNEEKVAEILDHEMMHKIIYELEGAEAGYLWDNLDLFPFVPTPYKPSQKSGYSYKCAKCRKHTKHCRKCSEWLE